MESNFKIGQKIGDFTVIGLIKRVNTFNYVCECTCGKVEVKWEKTLCSRKDNKACKLCNKKKKISHRTRTSYCAMVARCTQKGHDAYTRYSNLEVPICERWLEPHGGGFENFLGDMGLRPEGLTLDRIDNSVGYSKENCRWATPEMQTFNIKKKENNTSGKTGVYWNKNMGKWLAYIRRDGMSRHLGYFVDFEDAVLARKTAEIEVYGFNKD